MQSDDPTSDLAPLYGSRIMGESIPRWRIPERGIDPDAAYALIHDELTLDGNPLLNLASFVTTWMEPQADRLMAETQSKNFIDQEEYPLTSDLERRCVSIIADLFHAPVNGPAAVGTSTIGSSEAIHLCGLAMKKRWQARRTADGKDASRPNLVMSHGVHVTWEKFCRYFDVETREQPYEHDRHVIDAAAAMELVDENTIGVVGVLGTTYTGAFEPIADLDREVGALAERTGWQVPVHVDAASGGFVAPFAFPDLAWDFRLDNVHSINVSGHKFGLVYPGVGWAIWRSAEDLPDELIFKDSYLGAEQETFDLNFSKSASPIVGQYYNLIRLGRDGYTQVMDNLFATTRHLEEIVRDHDRFDLLSDDVQLPLVCIRPRDPDRYNAHDIAARMRERGWIIPAYTMPPDIEDETVLRVVLREGFSRNLADRMVEQMMEVVKEFDARPPSKPAPHRRSKQRAC